MGAKFLAGDMDEAVGEWVAARLPGMDLSNTPYTALGQLDGLGNIIGGVVFNNYTQRDVHLHTAAIGPRWLNRRFIGEVFRYVFLGLGCRRCTGLVWRSNEHAARFDQALGFQYEGVLRAFAPNDEDVLIFGMLREECRWLNTGVLKNGFRHERLRPRAATPPLRQLDPAGRAKSRIDAALAAGIRPTR